MRRGWGVDVAEAMVIGVNVDVLLVTLFSVAVG
jgi:hypothetical protein